MRADALGFFWRDEPVFKKPKAEPVKRTPPERVWESPDYLPNFDVAQAFCPDLFADIDLVSAAGISNFTFEFDVECYANYFLVVFTNRESGKSVYFEKYNDSQLDTKKLRWVMETFQLVGFNSRNYDETMVTLAISGASNAALKAASDELILGGLPGHEVLRKFKGKRLKNLNHIDLIEVAPSFCSLKMYAGRMHSRRMQDLPFKPDAVLNDAQVVVLRWYCFNDISHTGDLREYLLKQLELRVRIGSEYGLDLRSKSDAQVAEAVISAEMQALTGQRPQRATVLPGTVYYYQPPHFLRFTTPNMQWVFGVICRTQFIVSEAGKVELPEHLRKLLIPIGGMKYQMGIGGLHSTEKGAAHVATDDLLIIDRDVESFYPRIMILLGLFPPHLGPAFLQAFTRIVNRRLDAKHRKDKVTADSLKITINGTYGKLGSVFSFLYAPHQIIQVTLTGQLALLMLIERLELAGFSVVSANTDGIVTRCPKQRYAEFEAIFNQWELDTGFKTEETRYKGLYSRDVNNYIAVKEGGGYKTKGVYANPWDTDNPDFNEQLKHNPTSVISIEAALNQILHGVPVAKTVRECSDVRKFVCVRNISGGAVKVWEKRPLPAHATQAELVALAGFTEEVEGYWLLPGQSDRAAVALADAYRMACDMLSPPTQIEYLGKAVRWYYAQGVQGELVSAKSGHKVPRSDGAKPLMELPQAVPDDVNFDWYVAEAEKILAQTGYDGKV